jgi:hypothetical protein
VIEKVRHQWIFLSRERVFLLVSIRGEYASIDNKRHFRKLHLSILNKSLLSIVVLVVVRVCSEEGIPIHFISKRGTTLAGLYATGLNGTILTRRAQLLAYTTPVGIVVSKAFVKGKIANQRNLLRYFAKSRKEELPTLCHEIELVVGDLCDAQLAIDDLQGTGMQDIREQLLSIEGRAAQGYWGIVKEVLPPTIEWPGRETRGARDLFNALLNYGYGVLYAQVGAGALASRTGPLRGLPPHRPSWETESGSRSDRGISAVRG